NRQERFILTILPIFIILGVLGYDLLAESKRKYKIWNSSWIAFWVLNIPFLLFASTMYSKKSRVEAMYAIQNERTDNGKILLEGSANNKTSMLPLFYANDWSMKMKDRTDSLSSWK